MPVTFPWTVSAIGAEEGAAEAEVTEGAAPDIPDARPSIPVATQLNHVFRVMLIFLLLKHKKTGWKPPPYIKREDGLPTGHWSLTESFAVLKSGYGSFP